MRNYNKIIYILTAILVLYTVSFAVILKYSVTNFAFSDFYKRLDLRRNLEAERFINGDQGDTGWSLKFIEDLESQREFVVKLDEQGNILTTRGLDQVVWKEIQRGGKANIKVGNRFYSAKLYSIRGQNYIIGASAESYFYNHLTSHLNRLLFISLLIGVLFAVVVSLLVKRSFIKPINDLIDEVKQIGTENLYLRLNEEKAKGVLGKLTKTFNRMLNRIETAFETQKNFVSNASHELNTPLTSIIGIADLALSKEREVPEYKKAMHKIMEAAENLEKKTSALLLLARTGFQNNAEHLKPVRIDQIIMDAEVTVKSINEQFHIKTDFSMLPEDSMRLKVNGSAPLLQLAISNIISNACKYSRNHTAYVALGVLDKGVLILIKDDGIGIPEHEISHIYDPYFRGSNTGNFSGYGIGLPLSRNIVKMHDGSLSVSSSLGIGTTVRIELPTIGPL